MGKAVQIHFKILIDHELPSFFHCYLIGILFPLCYSSLKITGPLNPDTSSTSPARTTDLRPTEEHANLKQLLLEVSEVAYQLPCMISIHDQKKLLNVNVDDDEEEDECDQDHDRRRREIDQGLETKSSHSQRNNGIDDEDHGISIEDHLFRNDTYEQLLATAIINKVSQYCP